jgi:hypothetical protein
MAPYDVALLIRRGLFVGVLYALLSSVWVEAAPDARVMALAPETGLDFDIPAQPLAAALNQYANIAQVSVGAPSKMVRGLMSTAVRGRFSADEALRRLLAGTGLAARRQDNAEGASYFLTQSNMPAPAADPRTADNQLGYAGLIQSRIWQMLCADPRTTPGAYRLVFRFLVDDSGYLTALHLYVSTGDPRRDAAVLDVLRHVRVSPPPAAVQGQSVTMSLLPTQAAGSTHCAQMGAS